jgi:hypothetical protein
MFRFVVVTFEVLALIMILRSAFVQFWLSDMQTSASDWMVELSLTIDRQQLAKFREGIVANTQKLSEAQTEYLERITSTKTELNNFNMLYCIAGDKNPFIYGANLQLVCSEIGRKEILKKFAQV